MNKNMEFNAMLCERRDFCTTFLDQRDKDDDVVVYKAPR